MNIVYPIEKNDLKKIRDYLLKKNKIVFLTFINIGVNTALRYSDLSILRFEDIDKEGKISIIEKKTGKKRKIKLNELCLNSIKQLKKYYEKRGIEPKGYLFKSFATKYYGEKYISKQIDNIVTIQTINRWFKEIMKALDIPYSLGTHSLRKTWGYYMYKESNDLGLIMKVLNHSSSYTTLSYIGITEEKLMEMYENFII